MKRFFTSDLHFGDDRFKIYNRPFSSLEEQHKTIIDNWNSVVSDEDEVYVIGDVAITDEALSNIANLKGRKILIIGNYDEPRSIELLKHYFDDIKTWFEITINDRIFHLNHYPSKAKQDLFNIVGHIHGTWRIQRNMINVSVEAWNYTPVSEEQILFFVNAIEKYYDQDVFAGDLPANYPFNVINSVEPIKIKGPSVFLAGPTPRNEQCASWRPEFISQMKKMGFKGTILVPEPKVYSPDYNYDTQVGWEDEGLTKADIIVFWVPRDLKLMPGFTTNVEFGEWMKSGKIILGYPKNAEKMGYLDFKSRKYGVPVFHDMEDVITEVLYRIKKSQI